MALTKEDVFMRGTCRANRHGFLQGVIYAQIEAFILGRVSIRTMVDATNGLADFGWVDGNNVQFLTSTDGTKTSNVTRRVGRKISRYEIQPPSKVTTMGCRHLTVMSSYKSVSTYHKDMGSKNTT